MKSLLPVALTALLAATGCKEININTLGGACGTLIDTECGDLDDGTALVCVGQTEIDTGRCRTACSGDSDCTRGGGVCLFDLEGAAYCRTPQEATCDASGTGRCPAGLTCTATGCRSPCNNSEDCGAGSFECRDNACYPTSESPPAGDVLRLVARGLRNPTTLAVSPRTETFFIVDSSGSRLSMLEQVGGELVELVRNGTVGDVIVAGAHVYWIDGVNIMRRELGPNPGTNEVFASNTSAFRLAATAANLYWTSGPFAATHQVSTLAVTDPGGTPTALAGSVASSPVIDVIAMAGEGTDLVAWSVHDTASNGGGIFLFEMGSSRSLLPTDFVVDLLGTPVTPAWTELRAEGQGVLRNSIAQPTDLATIAVDDVAGSNQHIRRVAITGQLVVFSDPSAGAVRIVDLGGDGATTDLATNVPGPAAIAIGSNGAVYWVNTETGDVVGASLDIGS